MPRGNDDRARFFGRSELLGDVVLLCFDALLESTIHGLEPATCPLVHRAREQRHKNPAELLALPETHLSLVDRLDAKAVLAIE